MCRLVDYNIPIVFEWPRHNLLWKIPRVTTLLKKLGCSMTQFDGCQFGLKSARKGMYHFYFKKPWAFATNIPNICESFKTLCKGSDGKHQHDITCGINTKHSQYYTPLMAVTVHISLFYFFMMEASNRLYEKERSVVLKLKINA